MAKQRNTTISVYLQQILASYSQKVFEDESLTDFYNVISGIMFEKQGYLAQASLCYKSSNHPFAIYSLGYFYEKGLGGNKKRAEKAKACYLKVEAEIPQAKQALDNDGSTQDEVDLVEIPQEKNNSLISPSPQRKIEIENTVQQLLTSHSQKLNSLEFNQLLAGLVYEECGYPVQAYLIYRNTKHLPHALYSLAYLQEQGIGVPQKNTKKAFQNYNKANTLGVTSAAQALQRLAQNDTKFNVNSEQSVSSVELPSKLSSLEPIGPPVLTALPETTIPTLPTKVLLFSVADKSSTTALDEIELKKLGDEFHLKRQSLGVNKQMLISCYLGMLKILERRAAKIDESINKDLSRLQGSCFEIIKLNKRFPLEGYPGELEKTHKIELQYYLFKAQYYLSKHASEPSHREAHRKQAKIEAQVYCELVETLSTKEALCVKNIYANFLLNDTLKKVQCSPDFSQLTLSIFALSLARIHRNSGGNLFFEVIPTQYKYCPIQSIKLSLDLMQSALTMANDENTRKLVIRDIEFMKTTFPNEIKAIQENSPSIVDTSRRAITISKEEAQIKLRDLFDNYFLTIEALFAKDSACEVTPKMLQNILYYFVRESNMKQIATILATDMENIENLIKVAPRVVQANDKVTPRILKAH